jgi:hypothetical protein
MIRMEEYPAANAGQVFSRVPEEEKDKENKRFLCNYMNSVVSSGL